MRLPRTPQCVYDNVLRYLANEFAFGAQEHKVWLEMNAVEMAKKCYKNTPRPAPLQGANEKNNSLATIGSIHGSQSITSGQIIDPPDK